MFIKHIQIAKYRHLEGIGFGPFRSPSDTSELVVLAGPNGGGKSSVLELISLALSNMWSLTYQINRTATQSSFEVTIGLTVKELDLIAQAKGTAYNELEKKALDYLLVNRSYCRSFSYDQGVYAQDPALHNQMHDLVHRVLRGSYTKPLGFFISADRSYQRKGFQREKLFNYTSYSSVQHRWNFAFQSSHQQYEDMFDFLVTWRYHYARRLGAWYLRKEAGVLDIGEETPPPDEYGLILDKVFPGYRFVESTEDAPSDLFVKIPSGETISFSDLSSGEKEVFFMLSFFQRHAVEEAVILVDEPELHLHPSLARVMLRAMQTVKPHNQIWLASQSSEVIEEAGRDRVFFVRRNKDRKAEVVRATEEQEALACLRDFFGYSGYLGLARAMIFTEGRRSSADRKLFARLLPGGAREVKFIPSSASSELERINKAILSILEADVGWCQFFLIRDRDFLPDDAAQNIEKRTAGKLFVLKRHELENYLLSPDILAHVLEELYDKPTTTDQASHHLRNAAYAIAGNALRDMVAFRLNLLFRPEDFTVPPLMRDVRIFDEGGRRNADLSSLRDLLHRRHSAVVQSYETHKAAVGFEDVFTTCTDSIDQALSNEKWDILLPGKEILLELERQLNLGDHTVLQNALIKQLADEPQFMPVDLRTVLETISKTIGNVSA